MNVNRFFIYLAIGITCTVLLMVYWREAAYYLGVMDRPYADFSDERLEAELAAGRSQLAQAGRALSSLDSSRGEPGSGLSRADAMSKSGDIIDHLNQLRQEKAFRERRSRHVYILGFVVCLVVFLDIVRRVILLRDPREKRRLRTRKALAVELEAAKEVKPSVEQYPEIGGPQDNGRDRTL